MIARHWDANADGWTEGLRRGRDLYRNLFLEPAFIEFLGGLQDQHVLDAGCGEGTSSRLMARRGATVTGVDLSPRMLESAMAEEARAPLGIRYVAGSYGELAGIPDGAFDLVASWMSLMDGADLAAAARTFFRVLKPGGALKFAVIHPCFAIPPSITVQQPGETHRRIAMAGYFDATPRIDCWTFAGSERQPDAATFAVPRFPRTVAAYVNGPIDAGFRIRRLAEPRPSDAACERLPRLRFWRDHAALYLFVHADKPGA